MPGEAGSLRVPPHSVEAERGVLGSILLDPSASVDKCVARRLRPASFLIAAISCYLSNWSK